MPSYNKVMLMGHLTRDPALKFLPSQVPVTEFGVAVNRRFKTAAGEEKEEVTFVDCTAFAKTAELVSQYLTKGSPVFLEGRLKFDTWEDKQGGGKRSKLTVVAEHVTFIGRRAAEGGDDEPEAAPAPVRQQHRGPLEKSGPMFRGGKPQRAEPVESPIGAEEVFEGDDIPF